MTHSEMRAASENERKAHYKYKGAFLLDFSTF